MSTSNNELFQDIAHKLIFYRGVNKMSREDLALKANTSIEVVNDIESGHAHKVGVDVFDNIAHALGVDLKILFNSKSRPLPSDVKHDITQNTGVTINPDMFMLYQKLSTSGLNKHELERIMKVLTGNDV